MKSLSARLLLLTVIFVMLAEVLIFVPSVARFRMTYLKDRMEAAHLAVLVLEAASDKMISEQTTKELLSFVGAFAIAARHGEFKLSLMQEMPPTVQATVRPDEEGLFTMFKEAFSALFTEGDRIVRILGPSPHNPGVELDILMNEEALCAAVQDFAVRIFWLSLVISVLTAFMVFLVLQSQLVRPLHRLTRHMVWFRQQPEDQSRVIHPGNRKDEIGIAERELATLQTTVREALAQRRHLAALGTAVAKVNHDLRGILSSALILSDRLEESDDPEVRRIAPGLLDAIDRAVGLCSRTLNYVGHVSPTLELGPVFLYDIAEEAAFGLKNNCLLKNEIGRGDIIQADRNQVFRIFNNLFRNAAEAGATSIRVKTTQTKADLSVSIVDDGPGMAPRAVEHLFQPFEGSAKAGGTGLGLSIARELARSHGGDLILIRTHADGTCFRLTLPREAPVK